MVNFQRSSIDQFNDLSSIDQYQRAIEEGLSQEEALKAVNRRSRDNARTPFQWTGEQYGGFSQAKLWLVMTQEYPAINAQEQQARKDSVLQFYKDMIAFRQNGPCSQALIWGSIAPVESSPNVIAYCRETEGQRIWCWFNLGDTPAQEPLPASSLKPVWGNVDTATLGDGTLTLPPYQFLLLEETL